MAKNRASESDLVKALIGSGIEESVAIRLVDGCMRSSKPFGRVAASRSFILMPGSQRTIPGFCHSICVMLVRSSSTPPWSGTA